MRRYYKRKFEHLVGDKLDREIQLVRALYEQNYDLLIEAHDRKDWEKHQEYCQKEAELEKKSIRLINEWQRRKNQRRKPCCGLKN